MSGRVFIPITYFSLLCQIRYIYGIYTVDTRLIYGRYTVDIRYRYGTYLNLCLISDITKEATLLGLLLAVRTGLEPATPCVTGMYSNQLNYRTILVCLASFSKPGAKVLLFFELTKCFSKKNQNSYDFAIFIYQNQEIYAV